MNIVETARAQTIANAPTFAEVGGHIVNFLASGVGTIAIIGLVVSAVIYFTAGGSEDRIKLAKKSTWYCIVGIIVAIGALLFVKQTTIFFK